MSRIKETGFRYFPLDTSFFSNVKIKRLIAQCRSADGFAVYLYLLCRIYGDEGYYVELNDDLFFDICVSMPFLDEAKVKRIIKQLFERSLFDIDLAKSECVLSSKSIQLQFQEIEKRKVQCSKGKRIVKINLRYWLLSFDETEEFIKSALSDDNLADYEDNPAENEDYLAELRDYLAENTHK